MPLQYKSYLEKNKNNKIITTFFQISVMKSIILLPLLARTSMISIFVTTITFFWRHLNIANELSWHIHEKKSTGYGISIHNSVEITPLEQKVQISIHGKAQKSQKQFFLASILPKSKQNFLRVSTLVSKISVFPSVFLKP